MHTSYTPFFIVVIRRNRLIRECSNTALLQKHCGSFFLTKDCDKAILAQFVFDCITNSNCFIEKMTFLFNSLLSHPVFSPLTRLASSTNFSNQAERYSIMKTIYLQQAYRTNTNIDIFYEYLILKQNSDIRSISSHSLRDGPFRNMKNK